jgi:PAP2 superfamily C-terminal
MTSVFSEIITYADILKDFAFRYGLVLILALVVLLMGKFLIGRFNFEMGRYLRKRTGYKRLVIFFENNNVYTFLSAWRDYFKEQGNKSYFAFSFAANAVLLIGSAKLLAYNATRPGGFIPPDPLMEWLVPRDFSAHIFVLEYMSVIMLIFYMTDKPYLFVKALWSVSILMWIRTFTVIFMPLSPSPDMIFLKDPFAQYFFGDGVQVTNDLFFSGHVGLLAFFFFIVENKYLRLFLLVTTLLVGLMLVWQQVHYTTDVVFAPLFSKLVYELVTKERAKFWLMEKYQQFSSAR